MKNENVLCTKVENLNSLFDLSRGHIRVTTEQIDKISYDFMSRALAETDYTHKQIICYAILENEQGNILSYRRMGSEQRLQGLCSVGIGGHVNDTDLGENLMDTVLNGLVREIREETGLLTEKEHCRFLGLINEDESPVGWCHVGLVFNVHCTPNEHPFHMSSEIGTYAWTDRNAVNLSSFELWSRLALKLL